MITQKIIKEILQDVVNDYLIPKFNELKMNASGEWIKSIEVRVSDNIGEIWAADYTHYLVNGRKAGSMPPVQDLEKYVMAKWGLYGKEANRAAWALAVKIKNQGTSWHKKKGSDLLEVLQSRQVTDYINNKMSFYLSTEVALQIKRMVKQTLLTNG